MANSRVPRSVVRLRLLAVVPLLLVLIGALYAERLNDERHLATQRGEVERRLGELREQLDALVQGDLQLVRGLVSVVALKPQLTQQEFERVTLPLLQGRTQLRNVAAAPDMVIRLMAPLEGNERAIGLDYRNTPGQRDAAEMARTTHQIVVAGPINLVQGGLGLVLRLPIYLDDGEGHEDFWGLVSAVVDAELLFKRSGLREAALDLDVAIRGRDAKGPAGELFYGRTEVFAGQPVLATVQLPQGSWQLAATPLKGWPTHAPDRWTVRGAFIAAALVVLAVFAILDRQLRATARAHRRARTTQRQLAALLEATPDAMVVTDAEGRIRRVNSQAVALFGYEREAMIDRPVTLLLASGSGIQPNALGQRADGGQFPIEQSAAPLPTESGLHTVRALRDITARRRTEQELEQHRHGLERRIAERTRELHEAMQASEAANKAKSAFLANMSHEIRTPLNAITGMVYLIRRTGVSDEQAMQLDQVEAASAHLLRVINAILDLSKIDAERFELAKVPLDLQALVADVVAMVHGRLLEKGLTVETSVCQLPEALLGDTTRLKQALLNYAANAVSFTDRGGIAIRVSAHEHTDERVLLFFEVEDSGVGIPADVLQRLFAPFEQADNSLSRPHGGTGLGLAITRKLAQLMGGDAGADSTPGRGSRFWFSAWIDKAGAAAQPAARALALPGPRPLPASAGVPGVGSAEQVPASRLLLAEDDAVNRLIAEALLTEGGHRVDVAADGAQALEMAAEVDYDLILMDVQMPTMNGLESAQRIRALPQHAHTPIIAVTANAFDEDRRACMAAGMSDFIGKPFDPRDLKAVLARWLH